MNLPVKTRKLRPSLYCNSSSNLASFSLQVHHCTGCHFDSKSARGLENFNSESEDFDKGLEARFKESQTRKSRGHVLMNPAVLS